MVIHRHFWVVIDIRFEVMPDPTVFVNGGEQIVVNRRSGPAGPALLFGMGGLDPGDLAKPVNPVLAGNDPGILELIGEEPVTQRRVIFMDLNQLVDDLGVIPLTPRDRLFEPFVIPLG